MASKRSWLAEHEGLLLGVLGMVALLAIWEVVGRLLSDPNLISAPSRVFAAGHRQVLSGQLLLDTLITLKELVIGFGLAVIVGVPVGLLMGWNRWFEYALDPYLWFFYSAPTVALYPLLIFWLGLGQATIVVLTFLLSVFVVVANTMTGVHQVEPVLIRAAQSFGASPLRLFRRVILPAALPAVATGLRLGIGRALIGAVLGEFFGANAGLGYRISFYGAKVRTADLLVPILVLMVVGALLNQGLHTLQDRLSRWRTS